MPINKVVKSVLKKLSYGDIEVKSSRSFANLKAIDPLKAFYKKIDYKFVDGDNEIPTRIYFPGNTEFEGDMNGKSSMSVLLFLHGGGWITESVDTYDKVCSRLSDDTEQVVISVGYRLAPEFPFPAGLEDCYAVARAVFTNHFLLNIDPEKVTLIGDSAGGNLAASLSLLARERGEFMPRRQILIYPALNNDYTKTSPYPSVKENGTDYLLTSAKIEQYLNLYQSSDADRMNPYFAPILATDLSNQPKTLILTAEYDPLRDEGEEYGARLKKAGNVIYVHRIKNALHGYFALGIKYLYVRKSFDYINKFLKGE